MGRTVNFDEVPDSQLLDPDLYELEVEDLSETVSKAGNLMYKGVFRVAAGPYEGTPLFEYYTIGNPEDPNGEKQETWNNAPGSRRLKRLFKALMIPTSGDMDQMVEAAKGQHFIARIEQRTETKEGQYQGTKRNEIAATLPLGSRAVGASTQARQIAPTPPSASAAKAPTPTSSRAAKAATAATVTCPYCTETMARSEYSNHKKTNHPDED